MSKPLIALLGLIALGLLCFFCIRGHVPTIQIDLIARTSGALAAAGIPWASANADGRELILEGVAPNEESRKQAGGIARQVWGVRTVDNRLTVAMAEPTPTPTVSAPEPSPVAACQQQFDEVLGNRRISFETDSATLKRESTVMLDKLAAIADRCPDTHIQVAGHTDARGSDEFNLWLSQARAESVTSYLTGKGVDATRLSAIGYGASQPIADNVTAAGLARNRRIGFRLEEK
ncbi:MAG: BON domain-containing protein [Proteobacteria bacterium]|nr:MAG: BON domain-containing protein [Pseudomonadota bacterium]